MTTPDVPLRFEFTIEVPGPPEQVWDALATANGISSWMMRRPLAQMSSTNFATWPATMMEPRSPPGRGMKSAISHTSVMRWATPRMTAARNADRGGRGCGFNATVEAGSPPITSQISGCFSAITRHKLVLVPDPITERSSALRM